jgi:hypothetical protein
MSTYACCLVPSASPKRHCHCHCRFLRHMLHCRLQLVSLCAQRATYITVTATITITCCTVASDWCRFVPNVPPTSLSLPPSPSLAALSPPIGVALCPTCHLQHCHGHHHLLHCHLQLATWCPTSHLSSPSLLPLPCWWCQQIFAHPPRCWCASACVRMCVYVCMSRCVAQS